jgi:TetR/AcrR family transcriptional regulator, ethionamide resistance regulator
LVLINNFVDVYRRALKVGDVPNLPTHTEYAHASRGRRSPHHSGDDREQAILATAERLLQERPLADFSVDDLAKGAGISRPTFYFYFRSKNAVLLSLLDQMNSMAQAALEALGGNRSSDPATVWRARIEAFFEVSGSHRAVAVAGAAAKATNPEVRQLWSTLMQRWMSYTTAAIKAERERGAAPDTVPAEDLSVALNMLSERVMAATFTAEEPAIPEDRVIDTLVHIWLASIYEADGKAFGGHVSPAHGNRFSTSGH